MTMNELQENAIGICIEQLEQDTDVSDDFAINYNEGDADQLAEKITLLRKPPQSLLYMAVLTIAYCRPELALILRDVEGQEVTKDDYLLLPTWTERVNVVQLNAEKLDKKITEAREKKEHPTLHKSKAKRVGKGGSAGPKKKKAKKNSGLEVEFESERTISPTPLRQSYEFKKRTK
ncbi:hypothetical protein Tco_1465168 [Tanacetum coccineum]